MMPEADLRHLAGVGLGVKTYKSLGNTKFFANQGVMFRSCHKTTFCTVKHGSINENKGSASIC